MTSIPVLGFTATENGYPNGLAFTLEADLYIPTIYHLDRDMTVLAADVLDSDPGAWL